jgi:hypothetical protein
MDSVDECGVGEPSVRLFSRRKAGEMKSKGFKGRAPSVITLKILSKYFGMPQVKACQELEISLATMKRVCRKFGVTRWPGITSDSHSSSSSEPFSASISASNSFESIGGIGGMNEHAAPTVEHPLMKAATAKLGALAQAQQPADAQLCTSNSSSDGEASCSSGSYGLHSQRDTDGLDVFDIDDEALSSECESIASYCSSDSAPKAGILGVPRVPSLLVNRAASDAWLCSIDSSFVSQFLGSESGGSAQGSAAEAN